MKIFDVHLTKNLEKSLLFLKLAHPRLIFKLLFYPSSMVHEIFVNFDVFRILDLHGVKAVDKIEFVIGLLAYIMSSF